MNVKKLYSLYTRNRGCRHWARCSDYAYHLDLARAIYLPRIIENLEDGRDVRLLPVNVTQDRAQGSRAGSTKFPGLAS